MVETVLLLGLRYPRMRRLRYEFYSWKEWIHEKLVFEGELRKPWSLYKFSPFPSNLEILPTWARIATYYKTIDTDVVHYQRQIGIPVGWTFIWRTNIKATGISVSIPISLLTWLNIIFGHWDLKAHLLWYIFCALVSVLRQWVSISVNLSITN